jgi:hypothetical protein
LQDDLLSTYLLDVSVVVVVVVVGALASKETRIVHAELVAVAAAVGRVKADDLDGRRKLTSAVPDLDAPAALQVRALVRRA